MPDTEEKERTNDPAPETVATPEGDNEYPPDAPLGPVPEGLQRWPAIDTNNV